jgi:hypothetical protein
MSLEAGIRGPILDEATKGLQRRRSIEQGRTLVPPIHTTLNQFLNENVKRDKNGQPVHDGRGWSQITIYLKPETDGEEIFVNLIRHVKSQNNRVDIFVDGLDTTIRVEPEKIELATTRTVPQRTKTFYESMRAPTGSSEPSAPPFEIREATLEEVKYVTGLAEILTDPFKIKRIGQNKP